MARDSDAEDIAPECETDANHVRIAATFVDDEAPKLHPTFGGAPSFDPDSGHFRYSMKFETLALALRDYVPASLRVDVGPNTPKIEWDGLFDQINNVEEEAHGTEHGPRAIFCSLALKIGENKEVIDPWISLIPNEYGLAVVKCAVAVMLNAAEKYAEERQKLFDALIEIRETIGEASSKTKSFQQEPEISKCAEVLYKAIVTAIQDILQSLPTQKPPTERRRLIPKWARRKDAELSKQRGECKDAKGDDAKTAEITSKGKKEVKQKNKKIDIDAILEGAREAAKDLDRAVDEWKTNTMLKTGEYSKDTNEQVAVILGWVVTEADPIIKDTNVKAAQIQTELLKAEERQTTEAKKQSRKMDQILQLTENFSKIQARGAAKEALLEMALAEAKKENSNLKKKMRLLEKQRQRKILESASRSDAPRAVLTLEQLLSILLDLSLSQERTDRPISDIDSMLEHLNDGLDTVLRRRARVSPHDQGQAQSLFQETNFLAWLESEHPDMLLVDGNMESASRNKVSAMSLFCANFVLTMTTLESQDVYTHFFCGCHNSHMDPWQGPKGLLQSVIIQLLAVLDARGCLSLDFLSTRSQVKELEKGDIGQLCRVFYQLVNEFPPGTTIYCIIDGIQFFGREPYLSDCDILVRHLRAVVEDDHLKPKFKVLMTVPFRSPGQLKKMVGEMRYTRLRAKHLSPGMITRRGFENRLGQRSTPSPSPSSRRRSRDAWIESERVSSDSSFSSESDETDY